MCLGSVPAAEKQEFHKTHQLAFTLSAEVAMVSVNMAWLTEYK